MTRQIPTDKARQGHWGRPVLLVLLCALALAMVVWVGVELYGESIDPPASDLPTAPQAEPPAAEPAAPATPPAAPQGG